jgi:hypothetical protein
MSLKLPYVKLSLINGGALEETTPPRTRGFRYRRFQQLHQPQLLYLSLTGRISERRLTRWRARLHYRMPP